MRSILRLTTISTILATVVLACVTGRSSTNKTTEGTAGGVAVTAP